MSVVVQWASLIVAAISAGCWFRSAYVKVTREQEVARRQRVAAQTGAELNLAGVTLDGWDMSATLAAQSKWNAAGAIFAGIAVVLQAAAPLL